MPDLNTTRAGTLYLIHVLTHATRSWLDNALSDLGLTSFHYTVLSMIAHNEGLSSSQLSRRFYVTPQAMSEVILLMDKRGLIVRSEDPANRKVLRLRLTREAHGIVEHADRLVATLEGEIFADLTKRELVAFREVAISALNTLRLS